MSLCVVGRGWAWGYVGMRIEVSYEGAKEEREREGGTEGERRRDRKRVGGG